MKKNILKALLILVLSLTMVAGTFTTAFADENSAVEEVVEDVADEIDADNTSDSEDTADEAENTSDDEDNQDTTETSDNQEADQNTAEQANVTDSDDNTADEAGQTEVAAPAEENIQELEASTEGVDIVTDITNSAESSKDNTGEKVMNDNSFGFGVLPVVEETPVEETQPEQPVVEETQPEEEPTTEEENPQPENPTPVVETPENPQPENPTPVVETPENPQPENPTPVVETPVVETPVTHSGNGGGVILHPVTIIEFPKEIEEAPEQMDENEFQAPVQPEMTTVWETPEIPNRGLVQTGDENYVKMMLNAVLCILSLIVFIVSMFSKTIVKKTSVNANDENNKDRNVAEVVKTARQMYGIPYIISENQFKEEKGELFSNGNLLLKSSWVTFPSPQNV